MAPSRPLPEVARKLVLPTGITSSDWPLVRKICSRKLGVPFDQWQEDAGKVILARRADGDLAAMVDGVGMSLPRQVGKTYLIAALTFALCIQRPGLLVIWSAHHGKTHAETFLALQGFAQRLRVAPYVEQVYKGSGDEEVRFVNGSRILFGAREHGFGRGIPGVDMLVFDEAQILSDKAMAAMLATMNVSAFGLALYIGTPPRPEDNSESFKRMRSDAFEGRLTEGAWIEFGAEPGADPDDRAQLARANPSYPHRTPEKSIQRLKRKLTPEDFLREGLGIWDEDATSLALPKWDKRKTPDLEFGAPGAIGLAAAVDHAWASIAAAGGTEEMVVVGAVDRRPGTAWLVAEALRIQRERNCGVVIDKRGPLADLIPALVEAGVRLTEVDTGDFCDACAQIARAVEEGTIQHGAHPELDRAVHGASWRPVGDRRAFARKTSEISMLEAATLAAWAVTNAPDYNVLDSLL